MTLRVHWLQHAEHEGLGAIGPWLEGRGAQVGCTRLHAGEPLPRPAEFDWLVVMGGPMNIYEYKAYPWLRAEKELITDARVTNKKILGICLGSQLLADVLGGRVTRNSDAEIGWFDVMLTEEGRKSRLFRDFPAIFPAFHWHGDTFALPHGAHSLMSSPACANQAFAVDGGRAVGLQFHFEVREADVRQWVQEDPPRPGRYVQDAAEMLREPQRFAEAQRLLILLLERMAGL